MNVAERSNKLKFKWPLFPSLKVNKILLLFFSNLQFLSIPQHPSLLRYLFSISLGLRNRWWKKCTLSSFARIVHLICIYTHLSMLFFIWTIYYPFFIYELYEIRSCNTNVMLNPILLSFGLVFLYRRKINQIREKISNFFWLTSKLKVVFNFFIFIFSMWQQIIRFLIIYLVEV